MKKLLRRFISMIICIMLSISMIIPSYAMNLSPSRVEIRLSPAKAFLIINGRYVKDEASFESGGNVYVPMRTVLEALGAEVNWLGNGRINIVYRNVSIELKLGAKTCVVNQVEKNMQWAPESVNKTTMVSLQFIKDYFGVSAAFNTKAKEYVITQIDDGALTDLTFLVDSISKPMAGDSYFGWALNIPKGSRIINKSFNSKQIYIENENRGLGIEISIVTGIEDNLADYFNGIMESPGSYLDGDVADAYIDTQAVPAFCQFLYSNSYGEAVLHRVYNNGGVFYNLKITSINETIPEKLLENTYISDIAQSFRLDYTGNGSTIQDLTSISFGSAKYENYVTADDGKKYFTWEIDVLPQWDILDTGTSNIFSTRLGLSSREYMNIEINKADGITDVTAFAKSKEEFYNENFNEQNYLLLGSEDTNIGSYKASKITYYVQLGKAGYVYEEYYMVSGSLLYSINFRIPAEKYQGEKDELFRVLSTLKPSSRDSSDLEKNIEKYNYDEAKKRVGKDDNATVYENNAYAWSMQLPGYWTKNNSAESRVQSFLNPRSGSIILVEAVENLSQDTSQVSDAEKFFTMSITQNSSIELLGKGTMKDKGKTIRTYRYRLENEDEESYADINIYIISTKKYSYCFISTIPDLCSSAKNIEEMKSIWNSFEFETISEKK
jgi:hypothetical protein